MAKEIKYNADARNAIVAGVWNIRLAYPDGLF